MHHARCFALAWLILACVAPVAAASVTFDQDATVILRPAPGGGNAAFAGTLRMESDTAGTNVTFFPEDLLAREGKGVIDRGVIDAPPATDLPAGRPHDARITLAAAVAPGVYEGRMLAIVQDGARSERTFVRVILYANESSQLTLGQTPVAERFVPCRFSCSLSAFFFPGDHEAERAVPLHNPGAAPVIISNVTAALLGNGVGHSDRGLNATPSEETIPAGGFGHLALRLSPDLKPGRYNGSIHVQFADGGGVDVPVQLDVRMGPFVPALFIVLGMLAAWGLKRANEQAKPRLAGFARIDALRRKARRLTEEEDRAIAEKDRIRLRDLVLAEEFTAFEALAKVADANLDTLLRLEDVEAKKSKTRPMIAAIQAARDAIAKGDWPAAIQHIAEAEDHATARSRTDGGKPSVRTTWGVPSTESGDEGTTADAFRESAFANWWDRTHSTRIRTLDVVLVGIVWSALVIATCFLGLKELYVDEEGFGASPAVDLISLLVWGFTANVTALAAKQATKGLV